jgi:UDP-N-acetylmuramoyl-L-alanyl-D-glutamate--2,6-diaminopimelate ligase
LAGYVVVTDDNPRQEEAATIRAAVLAGARAAMRQDVEVVEIGDRKTAIEATLAASGPNDVVLVAGKGHEDGQIVGHQVLPFSDSLVVATWLQSQK